MSYDIDKPDWADIIKEDVAAIKNNLSLLRKNESNNSFPSEPVNGQFAYRTDIEGGAIYQRINSSWQKLYSNDEGFNQSALKTIYDNADSGLSATDVKNAIDEVFSEFTSHKESTSAPHNYDNTNSSLSSTDTQNAIDELDNDIDYRPMPSYDEVNIPSLSEGEIAFSKDRKQINVGTSDGNIKFSRMDFVNVKDFGAKGDGVTDDTQTIKNALNNVPDGGVLFFPPNSTYLFTEPVVGGYDPDTDEQLGKLYQKGITILGYGATLKLADNATYTDLINIKGLSNNLIQNVNFEGFTIDGNEINQTSDINNSFAGFGVIGAREVVRLTAKNIKIKDFYNDGIIGNVTEKMLVENCSFINMRRPDGSYPQAAKILWSNEGTAIFKNNYIKFTSGDSNLNGFSYQNSDYTKGTIIAKDNYIEGCTQSPVRSEHAKNAIFRDNIIIGNNNNEECYTKFSTKTKNGFLINNILIDIAFCQTKAENMVIVKGNLFNNFTSTTVKPFEINRPSKKSLIQNNVVDGTNYGFCDGAFDITIVKNNTLLNIKENAINLIKEFSENTLKNVELTNDTFALKNIKTMENNNIENITGGILFDAVVTNKITNNIIKEIGEKCFYIVGSSNNLINIKENKITNIGTEVNSECIYENNSNDIILIIENNSFIDNQTTSTLDKILHTNNSYAVRYKDNDVRNANANNEDYISTTDKVVDNIT